LVTVGGMGVNCVDSWAQENKSGHKEEYKALGAVKETFWGACKKRRLIKQFFYVLPWGRKGSTRNGVERGGTDKGKCGEI